MTRPARLWLAAVDPGIFRCGLAVFRDGILVHASEPEDRTGVGHVGALVLRTVQDVTGADEVRWVAETPASYPGKTRREGTLEELRAVVLTLPGVATYKPATWKGQVPKEVHHRRIMTELSTAERRVVNRLDRTRDALDAVGLGLWVLCRTKIGGRRANSR